MLPKKYTPALSTEEMLLERGRRTRQAALDDCCSSNDHKLDQTVWNKTLEEVSNGWLLGPYDPSTIPSDAPLSRRFGLEQRQGKVRLIDDFTESGVNSCVSTCESPMLHTTDVARALLTHWFHSCRCSGADSTLVARTFDLSSAYRQVGLSCHGRRFSYIRVFDPHAKTGPWFSRGQCYPSEQLEACIRFCASPERCGG